MRWIASIIAVSIVLGISVMLLQSVRLPPAMSDVLGVSYPTAILSVTLVFAVLHAASVLRGGVVVPAQIHFRNADHSEVLRYVAAITVWVAFIALLPSVGFVLASFAVVSASLLLLAQMGPVRSIVTALFFVLIFNAVFRYVLYVSTPQGPIDTWMDTLVYRWVL